MVSLNDSLFTLKKTYDYQSLCDRKKESKAAAGLRSVYVVSYISQKPHTHRVWTHMCVPPLTCSHILISTHLPSLVSLHERADRCKHTASRVSAQTVTHQEIVTLRGDQKGRRRYGESVRVGVTALGGPAYLVNTTNDVERSAVFHCLQNVQSEMMQLVRN